MKTILIFGIFFFNLAVLADACDHLKTVQMQINTIQSNISNINSTRTPEGGPYKRAVLECENDNCHLIRLEGYILKYEPGHPDADKEGYVKYPDIKLNVEINALIEKNREKDILLAECYRCTNSHSEPND